MLEAAALPTIGIAVEAYNGRVHVDVVTFGGVVEVVTFGGDVDVVTVGGDVEAVQFGDEVVTLGRVGVLVMEPFLNLDDVESL